MKKTAITRVVYRTISRMFSRLPTSRATIVVTVPVKGQESFTCTLTVRQFHDVLHEALTDTVSEES